LLLLFMRKVPTALTTFAPYTYVPGVIILLSLTIYDEASLCFIFNVPLNCGCCVMLSFANIICTGACTLCTSTFLIVPWVKYRMFSWLFSTTFLRMSHDFNNRI